MLLMIVVVLVVINLLPVDRSNPTVDLDKDFMVATNAPLEVCDVLKSACYDCHSHHTVWPWYSYVAPASWVIANHVEEGRGELNFSLWTEYEKKRKDHKLEECVEALTEGWMPDEGYVKMHEEANLTAEQKELLISFFKETRQNL